MKPLEIWPNGPITFGAATVDGVPVVMFELTDGETGQTVRVGFRVAPFVTFVDHGRMIADELAGGWTPPEG